MQILGFDREEFACTTATEAVSRCWAWTAQVAPNAAVIEAESSPGTVRRFGAPLGRAAGGTFVEL